MPTLYDIAAEYQAILQAVEFLEGELDEGLESLLDQVEGDFNHKAENIVRMIRNELADADSLDAEIGRLSKKAKARKNRAERLKQYLYLHFKGVGLQRLQVGNFTLLRHRGQPKLIIDSDEQVPEQFRTKVPESWHPDKKALAAYLKGEGVEPIDGIRLEETEVFRIS